MLMFMAVFILAGIGLFINKRPGWGCFCFLIAFLSLGAIIA